MVRIDTGLMMTQYSQNIVAFFLTNIYNKSCCDQLNILPFYVINYSVYTAISICHAEINLLKPTGYGMHQQVEHFNKRMLCPHCIYVFCICLRTNSDLCHLRKKLIGFL
jgi:hypothetical protein